MKSFKKVTNVVQSLKLMHAGFSWYCSMCVNVVLKLCYWFVIRNFSHIPKIAMVKSRKYILGSSRWFLSTF